MCSSSTGRLFSRISRSTVSFSRSASSESGLSESEVSARQTQYGPNTLTSSQFRAFPILIRQFKSSFVYLLIAAALIALFLGERTDAIMIFIFIAVDALLGFLQEYRSEKTVALLQKYTVATARIRRKRSH